MPSQTEVTGCLTRPNGRAVIFGAGAVGRGFIGEILLDAGWGVTFIDASPELVAALSAGSYPHDTVSTSGVTRKILTGCTAVASQDHQAVRRAVAGADAIFTCVGAQNLPSVAAALAAGLAERHAMRRGAVDVFIAENLHAGATIMRGLLVDNLGHMKTPDATAVLENVGFVETSIGRMIPVPTAAQRMEHPALVAVEPYRRLPFDLTACRARVPDVPDLLGRDDVDFSFYAECKLYIHNHGHCLTAYLGALAGQEEIAPTIADPRTAHVVRAAMYAAARSLAAKYRQSLPDLINHTDDLLERFANTALHDTVTRVGRDPQRKLQPGDRFLGTLSLTADWGEPSVVIPGLALAAHQLTLSRPDVDHKVLIAPVRDNISVIVPGLVGRFDQLLIALHEGARYDDFLSLLTTTESQ